MTNQKAQKGWYHDVDHNEDAERHAAQRARDVEAFGDRADVQEEEDEVAPPLPPPPPTTHARAGTTRRPI